MREAHLGPRPTERSQGQPGAVELPAAAAEPVEREPVTERLDERADAQHAAVTSARAREHRALPVGTLVLGAVRAGLQPGGRPRPPPTAERAAPVGAAVVGPHEAQAREQARALEVGFGFDEVAARGVDGIVRIARRRREAVGRRGVERDRRAPAVEVLGAQARLDRGVRERLDRALAAGAAEVGRDRRDALGLLFVELEVLAERGDQRVGVELPPAAGVDEVLVQPRQLALVPFEVVVGVARALDVGVEVRRRGRADVHRPTRAVERLAEGLDLRRVGDRRVLGRPDRRPVVLPELQVVVPVLDVLLVLLLPLARLLAPVLFLLGRLLERVDVARRLVERAGEPGRLLGGLGLALLEHVGIAPVPAFQGVRRQPRATAGLVAQ